MYIWESPSSMRIWKTYLTSFPERNGHPAKTLFVAPKRVAITPSLNVEAMMYPSGISDEIHTYIREVGRWEPIEYCPAGRRGMYVPVACRQDSHYSSSFLEHIGDGSFFFGIRIGSPWGWGNQPGHWSEHRTTDQTSSVIDAGLSVGCYSACTIGLDYAVPGFSCSYIRRKFLLHSYFSFNN